MSRSKARGAIIALPFLAIIALLLIQQKLFAFLISATIMLTAVWILYRHLADLTDISEDNPKLKALKFVTVFDTAILILMIVFVILLETGAVSLSDGGESYLASVIVSIIMLVLGNICPKLPFNRHTGLRLPWTVTDEGTWIVAHRIVGYLTLPAVLVNLTGMLLFRGAYARSVFCVCIFLLWIAIPGALSYIFYWKKFHGKL